MGDVVQIHGWLTKGSGYKSGRSSCRGTPEIFSTASTRSGGTSSHCDTACLVTPKGAASFAKPPAASIARLSASLPSVMVKKSSTALPESQASLGCVGGQVTLYAPLMTLGQRIKKARLRLAPKLTQEKLGERLGVTKQAVSGWERETERPDIENLPGLSRELKVPLEWLLDGNGDPPEPDADYRASAFKGISAAEWTALMTYLELYRRQQGRAA